LLKRLRRHSVEDVKLENVNLRLEDGFVEMAPDMASDFSGLSIEVEEWSGTFIVK
jgi:hypothetical protein